MFIPLFRLIDEATQGRRTTRYHELRYLSDSFVRRTAVVPTKLFVSLDIWYDLLESFPETAVDTCWKPGERLRPRFDGLDVYIVTGERNVMEVC